jgi:CheY-like chemotaxis protein
MPALSENPDSGFSSSGSDSRNSGQPTILVIDDDTSMQELMKYYLSKESWRIVYASSGKEGIRLAKELKPSMITLDILMPGMDGWSVLTTLKNDPEISGIPVMILSMTNDKHLSFALGASEFLTKPIQRDKLLPVLSKYLETPKSGTVLVIEDDITTGEMLTRMLEKEGYHPLNAGNGQIALDVMQTVTPQLILLDLMMPEMDGFEFVKQMRKRQEWSHIPVVVVTAKNITEEDRTRLNGSIANIIQKGAINREALLKEVRKLMTKQIQADL